MEAMGVAFIVFCIGSVLLSLNQMKTNQENYGDVPGVEGCGLSCATYAILIFLLFLAVVAFMSEMGHSI